MTAAARTLPFVLLAAACSSSPLEHEFSEREAMRVEVFDDSLNIDGEATQPDRIADAVRAAHKGHGGARVTALVLLRMEAHAGESAPDFERRRDRRKSDVLDALISAGVRQIQFGPPAPPPK